jgi:hypothetical protein
MRTRENQAPNVLALKPHLLLMATLRNLVDERTSTLETLSQERQTKKSTGNILVKETVKGSQRNPTLLFQDDEAPMKMTIKTQGPTAIAVVMQAMAGLEATGHLFRTKIPTQSIETGLGANHLQSREEVTTMTSSQPHLVAHKPFENQNVAVEMIPTMNNLHAVATGVPKIDTPILIGRLHQDVQGTMTDTTTAETMVQVGVMRVEMKAMPPTKVTDAPIVVTETGTGLTPVASGTETSETETETVIETDEIMTPTTETETAMVEARRKAFLSTTSAV